MVLSDQSRRHGKGILQDLARKSWCIFSLGCLTGVLFSNFKHLNSSDGVVSTNRPVYGLPFEQNYSNLDYHKKLIDIIHGASRPAGGERRSIHFTPEELFHLLMCERFDWTTLLEGSDVFRKMLAPYSTLFEESHGLSHDEVVSLMNSFQTMLDTGTVVDAWEYCVSFRRKKLPGSHRSHAPPGTGPSIAILMVSIGYNANKNAQTSIDNKRMYAERHGYSLHVLDRAPKGGERLRHAAWYKYSSALQRLSEYDYVWIIDVDTIITNMDQRLEDIVNPSFDMIVGVDPNGYSNTGSVIVRSSDWSKLFLMYLWSIDNNERSDIVWDQAAFEHAISSRVLSANPHRGDESLRLATHIMFVGQYVFNSDTKKLIDHIPFVVNFHAKAAGLGEMKTLAELVSSTFGMTIHQPQAVG